MTTNCAGTPGLYGLNESAFIIDVLVLALVTAPPAVGYTLWRMFVSNRTGLSVNSILRLNENTEIFLEPADSGISWLELFLYILTFGVFLSETLDYIQELLT
jgi:hypothetical protein